MLESSSLKILNLPSSCLRWETTHIAPLRMVDCAHGVYTITTSLCCCGTPSCRWATGTHLPSTMVGTSRSTACSVVRSTWISCLTPCFLMGAHGPRGLLGLLWMEMAAHRLDAPELALLLLGVSALDFCWLWRFLTSLLRVVYHKYVSMRHQHKCNAWVQRVICCMIMHDLTILTLISHLLDYPYHF
jgi:hypothetical protein